MGLLSGFLIFLNVAFSSSSGDLTSSLFGPLGISNPDASLIYKIPKIPICECDNKESFLIQNNINALINGALFELEPPDPSIVPCEKNTKILAELINGCLPEKPNCDLSYVVFILSMFKGKLTVISQGIRQRNNNILTVYTSLLLAESDVYIKYPDPNKPLCKVICMTKLGQLSDNIFAREIFAVELVVESGCCTDNNFKEPEYLQYSSSPLVPGYIVKQKNCFCTDFEIDYMVGLLESTNPFIPGGVVVLDQPNDLCISFSGSVFITKECKIGGIVAPEPTKLSNAGFSLPVAKEVGIHCVQLAGVPCARFIPGII